MRASNNDRLLITLTVVVLTWLTLLYLGALLSVSPGQSTRVNSGGLAQVAGQPEAAAANLPTDIMLTASEFKFNPTSLQLPAGKKVSITLHNIGSVEHDFTVDALGVKLQAGAGKTTSADFTLDKPGTYDFYCSIPGHKDAGMHGTLSVIGAGGVAAIQPGPAALAAYPVSPAVQAQAIAAARQSQNRDPSPTAHRRCRRRRLLPRLSAPNPRRSRSNSRRAR